MRIDPKSPIDLECPQCRSAFSRTRGWFVTHTKLVCPKCAAQFEIKIKDPRAIPAASTELDRGFYSKIVGVTFRNRDRTSRQAVISRCRVGERLLLKHETDNPKSTTALGVFRESGEQLGYLKDRLGKDLCPYLDRGEIIPCCISDLTGGGHRTRGVNIYVGAWQDLNRATPSTALEAARSEGEGLISGAIALLIVIGFIALMAYAMSH